MARPTSELLTARESQLMEVLERMRKNLQARIRRGVKSCLLLIATISMTCLAVVRAEEPGSRGAEPATESESKALAEPPQLIPPRFDVRAAVRTWAKQLNQGHVAEFTSAFAPPLAELLPTAKFDELMEGFEKQYGKLERVDDDWSRRRYGLQVFDILKLKWERAELELRLAVDSLNGSITALWIAPVEAGPAPTGFDGAGYRFGEQAQHAAEATLSLTAKVLDADGQPGSVRVWFYRTLAPDEESQQGDWDDPRTVKRWRRIDSDNATCAYLPVGTYRATAAERHRSGHSNYVPFGVSEPILLDGSQAKSETTVRLERGSSLIVYPVEAATGQALSDVSLSLKCADQTLPPQWEAWPTKVERHPTVATFDRLPGAKYELTVYGRASSPEDVERTAVETRILVDIESDKNRELTVQLRTSRLDDAEIAKRWPWVATGRVTDSEGRPIGGATVRAATGMGTLLGGGSTTTDAEGRYRLHFGQGIWSDDPVNLQSALISTSKPGYYETNLNRHGELAMARQQPDGHDLKHWSAQKFVFLPGEPHEVNFELARSATVRIELVDAADEDLVEASVSLAGQTPQWNGVASGETSRGGDYTFENVPVGMAWSITATVDKKQSARSLPFTLPRAENYRMKLRFRRDEINDLNLLEVQSINNSADEEIKAAVLGDDPLARPPVNAAQQVEAREILKKLAAANATWWFARPPAAIQSIRYDFCFAGGDRQDYAFEQQQEKFDHWTAHGLSYSSATAMLGTNRESVAFRLVEVQPSRIRLGYTTKARWGYSVGNGVRGTWHGFTSGPVREGILTIDPRRWVPLEHRYGDQREVFSDFIKLRSGQWAPRHVEIFERDHVKYDWTFNIYEPDVWLFSESRDTQNPDAPPIAKIENVVVNGQPAKFFP